MPKVVLSGYFGFSNAGDEAILAAEIAALRQLVPAIDIVVLSGNPRETAATYQVKAVPRGNLMAVGRALSQADLLISGGGSLLQDITSNRSIPYYLGVVALAKLLGKKAMLYSNGVGPINHPFNRYLVRWLGNWVDLITVRDAGSKDTLKQLGVQRPPMMLTADAVFTLKPAKREVAEEVLRQGGVTSDRPRLGISVRHWGELQDYKEIMSTAIDAFAREYNFQVVFLPLQHPGDVVASEEVCAFMSEPVVVIRAQCDVPTTMALYGAMDMVLGIRLHALVFAALQAVPHVGIVYDPKVASFLDIVDQPVGGLVHDLNSRYIVEQMATLWQQRRQTQAKLKAAADKLACLAWRNAELAVSLLKGEMNGNE
ncbi:MAG: polysaccharide pyruvyl transferase CsaB [bacterium]|jgi:polysaccharide pyruvyl transferase CsaB